MTIKPTATTTYSLTYTDAIGTLTASVTVVVAAVATPVITAPTTVGAGATGLIASVPVQTGASYAWTITGGTITAGSATNQITFKAGTSGSVTLGCVVTNAAGTSSQATATCAIVAAPVTPVISAPANVITGAAGLTATVSNTSAEPSGRQSGGPGI